MKEFFSKKWVFITTIALSAFFVIGLLIMLCVPTFYIGSYYGTRVYDKTKYESYITFKSGNQFEIRQVRTNTETGAVKESVTVEWYYKDGNIIVALGDIEDVTEELYKEEVKAIKALEKDAYETYLQSRGMKCNLLRFATLDETDDEVYKNKTAIVFIVINVVLAAASIAGAGYSTYLYFKNKKTVPADTATEE